MNALWFVLTGHWYTVDNYYRTSLFNKLSKRELESMCWVIFRTKTGMDAANASDVSSKRYLLLVYAICFAGLAKMTMDLFPGRGCSHNYCSDQHCAQRSKRVVGKGHDGLSVFQQNCAGNNGH